MFMLDFWLMITCLSSEVQDVAALHKVDSLSDQTLLCSGSF